MVESRSSDRAMLVSALDERSVGDLSLPLDFLKSLPGLGHRQFATRQQLGLRSSRALDCAQFVCSACCFDVLEPQLLAQSLELSTPGRNRFRERLALSAAKFDLPLVVLDVGAQGQQAFVAVTEDPLRLREFQALGLDGQLSLGE